MTRSTDERTAQILTVVRVELVSAAIARDLGMLAEEVDAAERAVRLMRALPWHEFVALAVTVLDDGTRPAARRLYNLSRDALITNIIEALWPAATDKALSMLARMLLGDVTIARMPWCKKPAEHRTLRVSLPEVRKIVELPGVCAWCSCLLPESTNA